MVDHRLCDFVTRQRRQGSRLSKVGPRKLSCPESVAIRLFELRRVFVNPSLNSSSCRLKHLAPPTHRRLPKFLLLFHYSFLSPVLWQRTPDWRCRQEPCRHKHVRLFVSPCSHLILIFEYIVSPNKTSYCSQVRRRWSSIGFLRSSER